jgi:pimeloyl-ACP methyl ester carboxylesterase
MRKRIALLLFLCVSLLFVQQAQAQAARVPSSANLTSPDRTTESTNLPVVNMTRAKMVSPTELGIAVKLWFPEGMANDRRFVTFSATIDGRPIEESFDVTARTLPGEHSEIGIVGAAKERPLDPYTPLRIDFRKWNVSRFKKNEEFTVSAVAFVEGGLRSQADTKQIRVLLPVIVIHGLMARPGMPIPHDLVAFTFHMLSKAIAYGPLIKYLEKESKGDFITGYNRERETLSDDWRYTTLWQFNYDSIHGKPEIVVGELDALIRRITGPVSEETYADRVNLIGHSLGGLIGRYYVTSPHLEGSDKVHRLIMVGTPNNGSSKFYTQSRRWTRDHVAKVLAKWPFLGWLVPRYSALYGTYQAFLSDAALPPGVSNSFPDDPPPRSVTYDNVYGTGTSTARSLIVNKIKGWYAIDRKKVKEHRSQLNTGGDGTVPVDGAHLLVAGNNMPVLNKKRHAELTADGKIQNMILYRCLLRD